MSNHLAALLASTGLEVGATAALNGQDPVLPSRFRIGEAAATGGGDLRARFVIHAAGMRLGGQASELNAHHRSHQAQYHAGPGPDEVAPHRGQHASRAQHNDR